jgi:hypothetical protein
MNHTTCSTQHGSRRSGWIGGDDQQPLFRRIVRTRGVLCRVESAEGPHLAIDQQTCSPPAPSQTVTRARQPFATAAASVRAERPLRVPRSRRGRRVRRERAGGSARRWLARKQLSCADDGEAKAEPARTPLAPTAGSAGQSNPVQRGAGLTACGHWQACSAAQRALHCARLRLERWRVHPPRQRCLHGGSRCVRARQGRASAACPVAAAPPMR